jgi:hypothetical protein
MNGWYSRNFQAEETKENVETWEFRIIKSAAANFLFYMNIFI